MFISRQVLAGVLALSLALGQSAVAQSLFPEGAARLPGAVVSPAPESPPAARPDVRLTDALGRQVILMPAPRVLRRQGWPPPPRPAWVGGMLTGFILGGYAGYGIAGHQCHCESGAAFLTGGVIGGAVGTWIVKRITR